MNCVCFKATGHIRDLAIKRIIVETSTASELGHSALPGGTVSIVLEATELQMDRFPDGEVILMLTSK